MKFILHAPNVHQGGGRTLLESLLQVLGHDTVAVLDERFLQGSSANYEFQICPVKPSVLERVKAEKKLRKLTDAGDIVLCFGNLPPLLKSPAQVFVYIQNRYLSSPRSMAGLPLRVRLRHALERLWLRLFLRDTIIVVQTRTMLEEVRKSYQNEALLLPFLPLTDDAKQPSTSKRFDYIYVASGESHKNHRRLIEAWVLLAEKELFPSLCLTIDPQSNNGLLDWIEHKRQHHGLKVFNEPGLQADIRQRYSESGALIYPSLFESFGLPLLEAGRAGLPIIAAEKDYVRDVVEPDLTFEPESSLSIARAVMRHMNGPADALEPLDNSGFIRKLLAERRQ